MALAASAEVLGLTSPGDIPANSREPAPGRGLVLDGAGNLPLAVRRLLTGYVFDYVEIGASGTVAVTATAEATPTIVATCDTINFDGKTPIRLEFDAPYARNSGTNLTTWAFYDGTTSLGFIGAWDTLTANKGAPVKLRSPKFTPSEGPHTYSVGAWVAAGTTTVFVGAGGAGAFDPGYIQIVRA